MEQGCIRLLKFSTPVVGDLRIVVVALKIKNAPGRIADLAVDEEARSADRSPRVFWI
ncbi:hypothetical protein [Singulisphaera sp. PoT]|uniref:hypothetical protein n=1 Tax=Singulisphaera sp. PoT TaxID=3411797 RepID=UPI003BF4FF2C